VPTRAETAFGYIVPGDPIDPDVSLDAGGACKTRRFVEKPGVTLAEELIKDGALWNTGIFLSQAQTVLDDLKEHTHELELGFPALEAGAMPAFSELISSVSIDRGLLERSNRVVALSSDFGWDDVGTWAALRRIRELDDTGNGVWGKAHLVDCESNIVHAEDDGTVVVYGLSGVLVVSLKGLTFVTTLERATELNPLLDQLPRELQGAERMRRQRPTS
jgi:mannose-1-phosphate guanylyltransferase